MYRVELLTPSVLARLQSSKRRWLVTGAAGFIGSNLVEALLEGGQSVVGLDNYSTGYARNVEAAVERFDAHDFCMIEGDIRDRDVCREAVAGCDVVLHQAALGSVPRSIVDPLTTHDCNVTGFLNMLDAARIEGVGRFVYAASSSTYGDHEALPKVENQIGNPLSPYAVTKLVNETYAAVYSRSYGFKATGLRYFNVFGPRQDPDGAYAAVIPKWVAAMIRNEPIQIHGDGETSRDFCFVANAVQANILAALAPDAAQGEVFNVAYGGRTTLNELFGLIQTGLRDHQVHYERAAIHGPFREGDVRHSQADITKAANLLGYEPAHDVKSGLRSALPYYLATAVPSQAELVG